MYIMYFNSHVRTRNLRLHQENEIQNESDGLVNFTSRRHRYCAGVWQESRHNIPSPFSKANNALVTPEFQAFMETAFHHHR